jgi:hypothetical protein
MPNHVDSELATLRTRDACVLAGICLPPTTPRRPGHRLRHAFLLRLVRARSSMRHLQNRGYLERGWSVDYLGAHCQLTDLGARVAKAAGATLSLATVETQIETVGLYARFILNLPLRV